MAAYALRNNRKRLSRQLARNAAIDAGEAAGQVDHTPATRQRLGPNASNANSCSICARASGGSPAIAWSTLTTTSARAASASGEAGNAPSSSTGTIALTIARARASSTTKRVSAIAGVDVVVYSQRAKNNAAPPAIPALSRVRLEMLDEVGSAGDSDTVVRAARVRRPARGRRVTLAFESRRNNLIVARRGACPGNDQRQIRPDGGARACPPNARRARRFAAPCRGARPHCGFSSAASRCDLPRSGARSPLPGRDHILSYRLVRAGRFQPPRRGSRTSRADDAAHAACGGHRNGDHGHPALCPVTGTRSGAARQAWRRRAVERRQLLHRLSGMRQSWRSRAADRAHWQRWARARSLCPYAAVAQDAGRDAGAGQSRRPEDIAAIPGARCRGLRKHARRDGIPGNHRQPRDGIDGRDLCGQRRAVSRAGPTDAYALTSNVSSCLLISRSIGPLSGDNRNESWTSSLIWLFPTCMLPDTPTPSKLSSSPSHWQINPKRLFRSLAIFCAAARACFGSSLWRRLIEMLGKMGSFANFLVGTEV